MFAFEGFPNVRSLQQMYKNEEVQMRAYIRSLRERDLGQVISYSRTGGQPRQDVLWHLLVHVVNHGTEHRSVIASELTNLGYSPGELDIIYYLRNNLVGG